MTSSKKTTQDIRCTQSQTLSLHVSSKPVNTDIKIYPVQLLLNRLDLHLSESGEKRRTGGEANGPVRCYCLRAGADSSASHHCVGGV